MLARMDSASASSVLEGFSRRLRTVPPSLRKTLTYDQGTEIALHQDLAKRLRMDIYFCEPHSPWQRGTNENMNGLVREYLPKGTSLASLTDADLRDTRQREDEPVTVQWCILHVIDHYSRHLGHLELTRQLWETRSGEGGAALGQTA